MGSATPTSSPGRTGWAPPASTVPRTSWPRRWAQAYVDFAAGESARGCTRRACASCRTLAGPSAAATWRRATATPFHAFTSHGGRARACSSRSCAACAKPSNAVWSISACATASTAGPRRRHRDGSRRPCARAERRRTGPEELRVEVDDFELHAQAVIVTSGGIGANHELVRANWPKRLGEAPKR